MALVVLDAMENPNQTFTGLKSGTGVQVHRSAPPKPSILRASPMYEEEKIDIHIYDVINLEDIGKDTMDENVDTLNIETLEDRLSISDYDLQDIINGSDKQPKYIEYLDSTGEPFWTLEDEDRISNKTSPTRWVSVSKKARDGRSCTLGSIWMWKILCLILAVTIVFLVIYTERPVYNLYRNYN